MVAGEDQALAARATALVVDREGKDAAQAGYEGVAVPAIELEQHLGVRRRAKSGAFLFKSPAQLAEIVDFAIEDDADLAPGRGHRLGGVRGRIDYRQTRMAERHALVDVDAVAVRTAVLQRRHHGGSRVATGIAENPGDSTHG